MQRRSPVWTEGALGQSRGSERSGAGVATHRGGVFFAFLHLHVATGRQSDGGQRGQEQAECRSRSMPEAGVALIR